MALSSNATFLMVSRYSSSLLGRPRVLNPRLGTSGAFGPDYSRTVIQFLWRLLNAGTGSSANYVKGVATGGNRFLRGLKGKLAISKSLDVAPD